MISKKKNKKISPIMIVLGVLLVIYAVILITIVISAFFVSVKSTARGGFNAYRGNEFGFPQGWPWQWNWSNYSEIFGYLETKTDIVENEVLVAQVTSKWYHMLLNTFLYTIGGALVQTMVPCLVAYATSKTNFKFSAIFDAVVLVAMIIPIVGAYPSELQLLHNLGLYNTWAGYYIQKAHCISAYYLVFKAMFSSMPETYAEAARIEGSGEFGIMFRIYVPLARTVILTVFLIHFITIWNDYNTSLMYMPSHPSLAYGIYYLALKDSTNAIKAIPYKMAGSFLLFTPILIVFICFRKVIMQNLSMGGIKE